MDLSPPPDLLIDLQWEGFSDRGGMEKNFVRIHQGAGNFFADWRKDQEKKTPRRFRQSENLFMGNGIIPEEAGLFSGFGADLSFLPHPSAGRQTVPPGPSSRRIPLATA